MPSSSASVIVPAGLLSTSLLLACLLLTACTQSGTDSGAHIRVTDPVLIDNGSLQLAAGIDLRLGDEVREALQSGIAIVISVDLRLGMRYRYFAREIDTHSYHWVLNYLPLSERYTLQHAVSGNISSYPRLRMLLDELRQQLAYPWPVDANQPAALSDGRHQLQVRARLNRLRLPAPLRLPALISSQWRLRDGWHTLLIQAADKPEATAWQGWTVHRQGHHHAR